MVLAPIDCVLSMVEAEIVDVGVQILTTWGNMMLKALLSPSDCPTRQGSRGPVLAALVGFHGAVPLKNFLRYGRVKCKLFI